MASAPARAVERLVSRLGVSTAALASYGEREQTRTDHLGEVAEGLGWRSAGDVGRKELEQCLESIRVRLEALWQAAGALVD